MKRSTIVIAGLVAVLAFAACSQDKVEEFRITEAQRAEGYVPDPLAFDVQINLCRSIGRKSGKLIGKGEHFGVDEGSRVRAVVDVRNLEPSAIHSFHLVWLKPGDLDEVFRKYAEVSVEETEKGWRKTILWKKAEDLTHFDEEIQKGKDPHVRLGSVMNVEPEKMRDLGLYTFRVYLNRELLTERTFRLLGQEITFAGPGDGPFVMGKSASVDAAVRLSGLEAGKEYFGKLAWRKPGGKKLFDKRVSFTAAADGSATLEGSLDISTKKKRKTGKYELRVYVEGSLVGEETFKLKKP